ncbi:MAG: DUF86 domain-containing protein [Phycisphaerae bacterium]|nr:DUF86 domain-containing protein [Phycisphaerae bacterium]
MKSDRVYLRHILDAIEQIYVYTREGKEAFLRDPKTQDAVIRKFEIIGEATKRLSKETKAGRSDISWRDVAGLRDVLIHNYMGVNLKRVWGVIEHDLSSLQEAVADLIRKA